LKKKLADVDKSAADKSGVYKVLVFNVFWAELENYENI
jgi:hypothetical protein